MSLRWKAKDFWQRAFCHEIDHLDGKMYVDLVEGGIHNVEEGEE